MDKTVKAKRYNVTGAVTNLTKREMRDGTFVTFDIERAGKRKLSCIAFKEKAAQLLEQVAKGGATRVFGYFEKRTVKDRTFNRFHVLWAGAPKAKEATAAA